MNPEQSDIPSDAAVADHQQAAQAPPPSEPPSALTMNVIYRRTSELREHPAASTVPRMSSLHFDQLCESMASKRYLPQFPIFINSLGMPLDGNHRLRAAVKNKIEWVPCVEIEVEDEIDFLILCALRRDLTIDQRSLLVLVRLDHLKKQRQSERASKAGKARHDDSLPVIPSDKQPPPKKDSRKELSEQEHISERKLRAAYEFKRDFPDEVEAVLRGERSIANVRAETKKQDAERTQKARLAQAKKLAPLGDWQKGDGAKKVRALPDATIRTVFIRIRDHAVVGEALKAAEAVLMGECHIFVFVPDWREEHQFVKALEARRLSVNARLIWHRLNDKRKTNGPVDAEEAILWATRGTPALKDQRDSRPSVVLAHPPDFATGSGEPPVAMIRDLLDYSTLVGECVLSPFGFPNCVIAARQRQRNVFAYEIDDANYAAGRLLIDKVFDQPSRTDDQIESALADPEPVVRATVLPPELQPPTDNESLATTGEVA